jgi:hypothetical protein
MSELERALERLSAHVEWPATPVFEQRGSPARRRWLVALALLLLALLVAFAVPPARSEILRFLDLGGVSIERVGTLPAAQERSLASSLGVPTTAADAQTLLGRRFRTPGDVEPRLYRSGQAVSALLATPDPVLLTELRTRGVEGAVFVKKLAGISTNVRPVDLGPDAPAVWISGAEHVYLAPPLPPRLAGNTLIWVRGDVTYRLEGKTLSLALAQKLAREIG